MERCRNQEGVYTEGNKILNAKNVEKIFFLIHSHYSLATPHMSSIDSDCSSEKCDEL